LAESQALLEALWQHVGTPATTWIQRWQAGDVIIWDNRCTMRRRDEFDPSLRRLMHRTQIQGSRPR
jgi:taurine dioxygenase